MPKIVDHEQRRRELADALWRIVASQGPAGVSIRSVAAEAGWSPGALRHYFPTREELLLFAMDLSEARAVERITRLHEHLEPGLSMLETLAAYAEQLLPLDDDRRAEYRAWESAGILREQDRDRARRWQQQRGLYRRLVSALAGVEVGEDSESPHADPWVEEWSTHLHSIVDGLALQLMVTPGMTDPEDCRRRLRAFLARVAEAAEYREKNAPNDD
ncbi:TetR/AcrR family transcriptional regulator [Nocardiopsis changdeensis]|uniref:TetR/AcrR family transcriptional regulator n=1 Tax=Nocardiopsis changdeensis TaxID=2831969 RepID=A0ABX8BUI4_9ACTN|nr:MULTISPECIES: TetR/AcrR family transcriptional regulator [Nocardiopsis]QUX25548.1 TetR/AcrR family transcriptional regulator [Nocardiopsis changdeensis]QYX35934.1 TetR/AcrR family transcriptional regulator [Nocardiopsis sp. MT53]